MTEPRAAVGSSAASAALNPAEVRQLRLLQALGTVGGVLVLVGTGTVAGPTVLPDAVSLPTSYTGMAVVVVCWLLFGRLVTPWRVRRPTTRQLHLTLALWAAPLLIAVPLFSRDLYSYLAVGETINRGIDPYLVGPVDALGATDSIALLVDPSWLHTPTPYGPAFLMVTQVVSSVVGHNIAMGVLVHRLIAVVGVLLIVWALPRLARICSFDPVTAIWLGGLNPLLLFHLIGGAHNEALMVGAMLAGLVIGLERSVALGAVLITAGVAVKATAGLALVFLVIAGAVRAGGRIRDLVRTGVVVLLVSAGTFLMATVLAGWGWGWVAALSGTGTVTSFLSVSTQLGVLAALVLQSVGVPVDSATVVSVTQLAGTAIAAAIIAAIAWRTWRGRLDPILGLGYALAAFVVLSPTVQQWYLLWAVLPIAVAAVRARDRLVTMWVSAIVAMLVTPGGSMSSVGALLPAALCAVVAGAVLVLVMRRVGMSFLGRDHPDVAPR